MTVQRKQFSFNTERERERGQEKTAQ
uniref:Uncharacterized protein n=1 Tax=Anguilla anguilla TaxID=7936 RepID=A0A0E9PY28_ANGAN